MHGVAWELASGGKPREASGVQGSAKLTPSRLGGAKGEALYTAKHRWTS